MSLVSRIKELASLKDLSIADVERRAHLSENSIYKWDRVDPGYSKVVAVADVLGVMVDELRRA